MINYVNGDLIKLAQEGEFDMIVHGCNCFCVMGAGIAKQLAMKYPQVYEEDLKTGAGDYGKLGNFTAADADNFIVINAYTQYATANGVEDVFEYTSFELILQKLSYKYGFCRFGFPRIGQGLANGDVKRITELLEKFSKDVERQGGTVTVVEYRP